MQMSKTKSELNDIEACSIFIKFPFLSQELKEITSSHKSHDEINFLLTLKHVAQSHKERMVCQTKDFFLCLDILKHLLFDDLILAQLFHGKPFPRVLLLHQAHFPVGALPKKLYFFKVFESHIFINFRKDFHWKRLSCIFLQILFPRDMLIQVLLSCEYLQFCSFYCLVLNLDILD